MTATRTTSRSALARVIAAAAVAWSMTSLASAAPIPLMVGGAEKQIHLAAALADRLGYFEEQGLDVRVLSDTSGRIDVGMTTEPRAARR